MGAHKRSEGGKTALVLSGGGARGAYQAGVLQGLVELGLLRDGPIPFPILVGTSAGSLNATMLAASAHNVHRGVEELVAVWSTIRARQVFRTDLVSLGNIAWSWIRDLSFGGLLGRVKSKSLLDTKPLRSLLAELPFEGVTRNVAAGNLEALAVAATDYYSSSSVLFLQGAPDVELWSRVHYQVERTTIGIEHLMASSAIPIFFPTIEIGGRHFGDGCLRNTAPLAPAIQLGAERILAIGVREPYAQTQRFAGNYGPPTVADIVGALLDAVMLDAIEVDVEHCLRVNKSLAGGAASPFRPVDVLWLGPAEGFASLAHEMMHRIPPGVRYLLRGLGSDRAMGELTSFLLFDPAFCGELIRMGIRDVRQQADSIRAFFAGERVGAG